MSFQPNEHRKNRERWTDEQLRPYHGKQVAWSLDGTQIVASVGADGDLFQAVVAAGADPEQVVFSYVDPPDFALIGGSALQSEDALLELESK